MPSAGSILLLALALVLSFSGGMLAARLAAPPHVERVLPDLRPGGALRLINRSPAAKNDVQDELLSRLEARTTLLSVEDCRHDGQKKFCVHAADTFELYGEHDLARSMRELGCERDPEVCSHLGRSFELIGQMDDAIVAYKKGCSDGRFDLSSCGPLAWLSQVDAQSAASALVSGCVARKAARGPDHPEDGPCYDAAISMQHALEVHGFFAEASDLKEVAHLLGESSAPPFTTSYILPELDISGEAAIGRCANPKSLTVFIQFSTGEEQVVCSTPVD